MAWLWGQYKEPFASGFKTYSQTPRNTNTTDISAIKNDDFSVSPNPFLTGITLQGIGDNQVQIEIYNALGALVFNEKKDSKENTKLDLSNLKNGIYVLKIINKNVTKNVRIVKT